MSNPIYTTKKGQQRFELNYMVPEETKQALDAISASTGASVASHARLGTEVYILLWNLMSKKVD